MTSVLTFIQPRDISNLKNVIHVQSNNDVNNNDEKIISITITLNIQNNAEM